MMFRLTIPITLEERDALVQLAYAERRHPRDQAALELRRALEQAGYLQPARPEPKPPAAREQPKSCAT